MNALEYLAGLSGYEIPMPKRCKHIDYCTGQKYSMKCNYDDTMEKCRLFRFYNKYGKDYTHNKQNYGRGFCNHLLPL